MDRLSFEEFIELCEQNADKKHVIDCIHVVKNNDCIFHSGIIMSQKHISSLYKLRFKIARESKTMDENLLKDYEQCVHNLLNSISPELGITSLYGNKASFLIFYEPDKQIILGVLKSNYIRDFENYDSQYCERYSKGVLIRS